MSQSEPLLRTRLVAPRLPRRALERAGLQQALAEALEYPLTVVQAGMGYGKTTALAMLGGIASQLCWYSITAAERDPQQFLSYLTGAFAAHLPTLDANVILAPSPIDSSIPNQWQPVIDRLLNALAPLLTAPTLLILDDYHFVAGNETIDALMQHFIAYMPTTLHVMVATRQTLPWPELVRWRARGELLEIERAALAFSAADIATLFHTTYGLPLAAQDIAELAHRTEGWPIALQLIWQGIRNRPALSVAVLLETQAESLATLFDYLAREVLEQQPLAITNFLHTTAVLRDLSAAACDAVRADGAVVTPSESMLQKLHSRDLFLVALGDGHYRYHHLFRDFLLQSAAADPEALQAAHQRAAAFFASTSDHETAIHHWLAAADFTSAAEAIALIGENVLYAGKIDTVSGWLAALPETILPQHPALQTLWGDIHRMHSRFDQALTSYRQAERTWRRYGDRRGISRALRGQANVYLDTVRPADAESLLAEALRLTDGITDRQSRARLLDLIAENKLNMGDPAQAEALRVEAAMLRDEGPSDDALAVRVQLRTGQLDAAEQILRVRQSNEQRDDQQGVGRAPRSHRETVLLLSLIQALRGNASEAYALAQQGLALGQQLHSPFVTAVAQIRLGHANQLQTAYGRNSAERHWLAAAIDAYHAALQADNRIGVPRLSVEAHWGLTRAYGFFGDLETAKQVSREAIQLGQQAGDTWIVALIELTLGASLVLAHQPEAAIDILRRALVSSRECGDQLGRAAAYLWLSLAYAELGWDNAYTASLHEALSLAETHGYDTLWSSTTLLGPPDARRLVPLLIDARNRDVRASYANQLLHIWGMDEIHHHPGYCLRIQTLGGFQVWRGGEPIEPREWQRGKARQLFQALLTAQGRPLQRETLCEWLWPEASPAAAQRDFKVALHALYKALEPHRQPDSPSAYILREGSSYRLRPEADLTIDTQLFEREVADGQRLIERGNVAAGIQQLETALARYHGDYLPEALYDDWATAERERLLGIFLHTAALLADYAFRQQHFEEALQRCQQILARDPCWEQSYRLMMQIYTAQGNRPQALRTYQRCVDALHRELGLEPDSATQELYTQIANRPIVHPA